MLSSDELDDIVRSAVALALAVELDDVTPDKLLIPELGAESIDFLDITFRLEQFLPISVPRDDLNEQAEDVFGAGAAVDTLRRLTPLGAYLVRERLLGVDLSKVEPGMRVEDVAALWTVHTWGGLCQRLLDTIPEQCPACGGGRTFLRNEDGEFHAECDKCATELTAIPGDELNQIWFEEIRDLDEVAQLLEQSRAQAAEAEAATAQASEPAPVNSGAE
ncbi:acyl carrier protein [Nocardia sp. NPDC051052]|uniref:acyl carrier protein n=1 Tax=Nocardia sp. NPDC051052 TaxID=3364322 RepID=UPI0037B38312